MTGYQNIIISKTHQAFNECNDGRLNKYHLTPDDYKLALDIYNRIINSHKHEAKTYVFNVARFFSNLGYLVTPPQREEISFTIKLKERKNDEF